MVEHIGSLSKVASDGDSARRVEPIRNGVSSSVRLLNQKTQAHPMVNGTCAQVEPPSFDSHS